MKNFLIQGAKLSNKSLLKIYTDRIEEITSNYKQSNMIKKELIQIFKISEIKTRRKLCKKCLKMGV